jgi:hypothetical protein
MAGKHEGARSEGAKDLALVYLGRLDEETMALAWGSDRGFEDRRRVVAAAVIFGRKFEERMANSPPESLDDAHFQRFLMGLMNAAIDEFAAAEGLDPAAAAAFLGDVGTRDLIFEFSDVLDRFAEEPETSLDNHLRAAVEDRPDRAVWSHHWRGGHRG